MSLPNIPPIDTSNPQAVQGIFSSTTETKKNSETPRKKLSLNDKTLTTRRRRLLEAHASSPQFKVNPKNNKNSSQVDTDSQKTSGKSDKNKSLKIHRIANIQTLRKLMEVHQMMKALRS